MRFLVLILTLLPSALLAAPLKIVAVNAPLADFAKTLGGDAVEVSIPIPQGEDPMTFQPDIEAISAVQQADLILLNGAGYAQWIEKVSLPRSKIVNTAGPFAADFIEAEEVVTHSHGGDSEHSHEAVANTTWLDFSMASLQAGEVAKAIIRKAPDQKDAVNAALKTLQSDLSDLHNRATKIAATLPGPIIASHPRYEYFAAAYNLNIRALHWEAGDVPSADQLAELDAMLAENPAPLFIWELPPNPDAAKLVEDRGLQQITFNPGDNTRGYIALMQTNLEALAQLR